jgi:serine protease Do
MIAALVFGGFSAQALGQQFTSNRLEQRNAPLLQRNQDAQQTRRDQLYADLEKDASLIEQHYRHIKRIVSVVAPTVVHVEAVKPQKSSASKPTDKSKDLRPATVEETGAGVVFQKAGRMYVLTNFHVIENSKVNGIRLEADGRVFYPTRLLHDRETDLSVLEVSEPGLVAARIGDSDLIGVGDFVVAVGSPFGLSHSVSYGIISAMGRHDLELGPQGVKFQNFFQTDAAINPGNSGGPMINLRGEVVGINTAIASNSGGSDGIGFSIPINMAMRIADDLVELGFVRRGFLGVSLDVRYTADKARALGLRRSKGALISSITSNSPAASSDLQIGDVIVEFDRVPVVDDSQLVTTVSLTEINRSVPVKVYRKGDIKTVYVTIGQRDDFRMIPTRARTSGSSR